MARTRPRIPLSAYDPRFRELLLRGGRETFDLDCKTPQRATVLRREIQTFRKRFREERGGPESAPLYQTMLTIHGSTLRFSPRSTSFNDILGEAPAASMPSDVTPPAPILDDSFLDSIAEEARVAQAESEKNKS